MKPRVAAIVGVGVLAAAGGFALSGAAEPTDRGPSPSPDASISAPPASVEAEPVTHVVAEPAASPIGGSAMTLAPPAPVEPGAAAVFEASWVTPSGQEVSGALDVQRIEGRNWTTVGTLTTEAGTGRTTLPVPASGIYRLAYGGSTALSAAASTAVTVTAGPLIGSHLTATVTPDEATLTLTAGWTTEGGVAISGPLTVEALQGAGWTPFTTVTTGEDGTAVARLDAAAPTRYRVSYAGGSRFAAAVSDETVAVGDDIRTVPVSGCSTDGEIDRLDRGAGCHYTPVTAGTFVVGHDYLGNAWWNAMPVNSYVELRGELAGVYEVVNRVIAPGRGSALGSASNWACGDDCDVILQTCQGKNTGFTWLRQTGN